MRECKNFVLGCNSYLGVNFCRQLDPTDTLLCSRSKMDSNLSDYLSMTCDLSEQVCAPVICSNLFLFSRPITQHEITLDRFYRNCRILISDSLRLNPQLKVHFVSTSLVFASNSPELLNENSPIHLPGIYERKKYEMELVLREISAAFPMASFNIHRVPLLVGGLVRDSDKQRQLFYKLYSAYRAGNRWFFDSSIPNYGTSFLSVIDYSNWLKSTEFKEGFSIYLPATGHISYRELQETFDKISFPLPIKTTMNCPSSFLYLQNNTSLKERRFEEIFTL